jgi:hypothetical protein
MAPALAWMETPPWLRRLAVDAKIYGDASLAALVESARSGDLAALDACRRAANR